MYLITFTYSRTLNVVFFHDLYIHILGIQLSITAEKKTKMGSSSKDWETLLAESTTKESDVTPGVVLQAVNKNGEIFYDKAAGWDSRLPDANPLKKDAIMWIASCTKLLTSVSALRCVERGQITLDEPVGRILPELANPNVIHFDSSAPNGFTLTPATKPITLRMLLTHTSGCTYEFMMPQMALWRKLQPPIPAEKAGLLRVLYDMPLLFEPGEGWGYGVSTDWAGEIVGRLNNTNLGDYFEEHIFKPLGMKSTTFNLDQRPDLKERMMKAGKREKDGSLIPFEGLVYPETVRDYSGGGGLWSCATDYIKVLADLIKDEPTLLKKETVDGMLTKVQIENEKALSDLISGRGAVAANAAPTEAGMNYGLGGLVLTKDSDVLPEGTLSWGGLPCLKWFLNTKLGVAALYATQVMPHGDAKNNSLSSEYFKEVLRLHKE